MPRAKACPWCSQTVRSVFDASRAGDDPGMAAELAETKAKLKCVKDANWSMTMALARAGKVVEQVEAVLAALAAPGEADDVAPPPPPPPPRFESACAQLQGLSKRLLTVLKSAKKDETIDASDIAATERSEAGVLAAELHRPSTTCSVDSRMIRKGKRGSGWTAVQEKLKHKQRGGGSPSPEVLTKRVLAQLSGSPRRDRSRSPSPPPQLLPEPRSPESSPERGASMRGASMRRWRLDGAGACPTCGQKPRSEHKAPKGEKEKEAKEAPGEKAKPAWEGEAAGGEEAREGGAVPAEEGRENDEGPSGFERTGPVDLDELRYAPTEEPDSYSDVGEFVDFMFEPGEPLIYRPPFADGEVMCIATEITNIAVTLRFLNGQRRLETKKILKQDALQVLSKPSEERLNPTGLDQTFAYYTTPKAARKRTFSPTRQRQKPAAAKAREQGAAEPAGGAAPDWGETPHVVALQQYLRNIQGGGGVAAGDPNPSAVKTRAARASSFARLKGIVEAKGFAEARGVTAGYLLPTLADLSDGERKRVAKLKGCVQSGLVAQAARLIEKEAPIADVAFEKGRTLLHLAACGDNFATSEGLRVLTKLATPLTLYHRDAEGNTPLLLAVKRARFGMVNVLVGYLKVSVDERDADGLTPLMLAASAFAFEKRQQAGFACIENLMTQATVGMTSPAGKTALHLAIDAELPELASWLTRVPNAKVRMDPKAVDSSGRTCEEIVLQTKKDRLLDWAALLVEWGTEVKKIKLMVGVPVYEEALRRLEYFNRMGPMAGLAHHRLR